MNSLSLFSHTLSPHTHCKRTQTCTGTWVYSLRRPARIGTNTPASLFTAEESTLSKKPNVVCMKAHMEANKIARRW